MKAGTRDRSSGSNAVTVLSAGAAPSPAATPATHQEVAASTASGSAYSPRAGAGAPEAHAGQKVVTTCSTWHRLSCHHSQAIQPPCMSSVPNQWVLHGRGEGAGRRSGSTGCGPGL